MLHPHPPLTHKTLCRLSVQVLGDERWADAAVLFFCINPASVFYSAAYTESLFAAFTFWGMLLVYTNPWTAVAAFTLAAMARSNGEPPGVGARGGGGAWGPDLCLCHSDCSSAPVPGSHPDSLATCHGSACASPVLHPLEHAAGILGCWFLMHALLSSTFRTGRVSWTGVLRCWIGCLTICAPYALMQGMTRGSWGRGWLAAPRPAGTEPLLYDPGPTFKSSPPPRNL